MNSLEDQLLKAIERECKYCEANVNCPFKDIRNKNTQTEKESWIKSLDKEKAMEIIGHDRMCRIYGFIRENFNIHMNKELSQHHQ